ncbi:MAG: glycosyltransferase family 4 protein [Richelia sp. RM2_1_2]|nr:glycosyltransferase family 4 protein [Richelia sp. SM1_7_0]NJN11349.1 glycosyltransferase family 4 protein [Richelia sp. RM1_1_1]NJO30084.1 glycosyltransferase family 4 protein [Richelia sp. SL_2_1]NJO61765.1 glycosyltransferase family 4 protein [Richelia sp. RM2_1_2]
MKILIVAEHASSKFGGEAFLPLNYFRLLRKRNIDARLLVHQRTQAELESLLPEECDRMYFVSDTWVHLLLWRLGEFLPRRLALITTDLISHLYTQRIQRQIVREFVEQKKIDVVHEPILVSPKFPSLMFDVGVPVVIGPMNGAIEYPPGFRYLQSWFVDLIVSLGRKLSNFANYLIPGKLQAEILLVANQRTRKALPLGHHGTVLELVENGVDTSVWQGVKSKTESNKKTSFVFIGRLVDWKAVDLLLQAFSVVAARLNVCLKIIGDGKQREILEAQTKQLNLNSKVTFYGWLSQKECADKLNNSDVLVLPSLLECGGAVVLEAMAMGIPVIATKWGGPADYLNESCGILIEPTSKEALVNGFIDAMEKLAKSPQLRSQLGNAGKERVRENFDWERKIDRILEIYDLATAINVPAKIVNSVNPDE